MIIISRTLVQLQYETFDFNYIQIIYILIRLLRFYFLADRTDGRANATVLRPSVCRL